MTLKWYGESVKAEIGAAIPDGLWEAGEKLLQAAEAKAPHGATGDLKRSGYLSGQGKSTYRADKKHNKEAKPKDKNSLVVGFAAFYARYHELGTKNLPARPFLRPAVDELKGQLGDVVVKAMQRKLK